MEKLKLETQVIGTGPYRLVEYVPKSHVKLRKNLDYWGRPLPYLDEVDFPIIPDDATRILKLQAGEVDGAELIPYARVQELKNDPNLDMALFPSTKVTFLTMNVHGWLTRSADQQSLGGEAQSAASLR